MHIWPAIDLREGKCVRLQQGDYGKETVFGDDPAAMARRWVDEGAEQLHLVDLDGARDGRSANLAAVQAVLRAVEVPCELGGGVRDQPTIERLLDLGLWRLVVGTQALKEPAWFRRMCQLFPHRLVLGIDAREGQVATDGWLETSQIEATALAKQFAGEPLAAIVYTDITRDGMLSGPNFDALEAMCHVSRHAVIASGGITTLDDVRRLATLPLEGCIIGRSLYEGTLKLPDALSASRTIWQSP